MQTTMRQKEEILFEIIRRQKLVFCDDQLEAEAVNHGFIQGLEYAVGLIVDLKNYYVPCEEDSPFKPQPIPGTKDKKAD